MLSVISARYTLLKLAVMNHCSLSRMGNSVLRLQCRPREMLPQLKDADVVVGGVRALLRALCGLLFLDGRKTMLANVAANSVRPRPETAHWVRATH